MPEAAQFNIMDLYKTSDEQNETAAEGQSTFWHLFTQAQGDEPKSQ
jgi:hypothetical protein